MSGQDQALRQAAQPTLCSAGCGFYSNVGTGGLCSKCFRDQQQQQQAVAQAVASASASHVSAPAPAPAPAEPAPPAANVEDAAAPVASSSSPAAAAAVPEPAPTTPSGPDSSSSAPSAAAAAVPPAKRPSPTRCFCCNKKVGLTGFSCKCQPDAVFCSTHRYAEAHDCAFDYKQLQKQRLEASNPLVQASKVQKL